MTMSAYASGIFLRFSSTSSRDPLSQSSWKR